MLTLDMQLPLGCLETSMITFQLEPLPSTLFAATKTRLHHVAKSPRFTGV